MSNSSDLFDLLCGQGHSLVFCPSGLISHLAERLRQRGKWPAVADDHETCDILIKLWDNLTSAPGLVALIKQPLLAHGVRFTDVDQIVWIGSINEEDTNGYALFMQSMNRGGPEAKHFIFTEEWYRANYMG